MKREDLEKLAFDYAMEDIGKEHYPEFGETKNHFKQGFLEGERRCKPEWHIYKKDGMEPSDGAMILFAIWYDGWHYGTGYYVKEKKCIILDDGMAEDDCTHMTLDEFDTWMEFPEPPIS